MRRILTFLKPYKIGVAIALFVMLVELSVELLQPFIIARIIDEGVMQEDLGVVFQLGGLLVGMSLVAFAGGIVSSFYAAHISQSAGLDIRSRVYHKVQAFSFSHFAAFQTSTLLTRMTNDVTSIQQTIFMSLRFFLRAPLLVAGSVVMALVVNWQLGLLFLITVPIILGFLFWVMQRADSMFRSVQAKLDTVNRVMQDNLSRIRLIRVFLRQNVEKGHFTESAKDLRFQTVSALRMAELTMPVILLIMNATIIGVLWFGNIQVQAGGATTGEIVALVNYATRMTGALSIFGWIIMMVSRARASSVRIGEVLDTETKPFADTKRTSAPSAVSGRLTFENVWFHYPDTKMPVLENVNFDIKAGERIAILGATGSGKTSLFQLIPKLYEADSGTIRLDGKNISDIDTADLRQHVGYVPQEPFLFTGTMRENIEWGKENATDEEIEKAAKRAQIHDMIAELPEGYQTRVGQKGVNLSGGQKQRVSIARAFVREPAILLLDDSTSALDAGTEKKLIGALQEYACTTLLITQKISTAMNADRVFLLEDGTISAQGTHEELLKQSELYRKITESQLGKGSASYV